MHTQVSGWQGMAVDMLLISPVVTLLSVWIGWHLARKTSDGQRKRQAAAELFQAFYGPELLRSRIRADKILKANAEAGRLTLEQLGNTLPIEDWEHVSRVRHFFAHLQTLREHGAIDMMLTEQLFGEHIRFWFQRHFSKWETADDITPLWSSTRGKLRAWAGVDY